MKAKSGDLIFLTRRKNKKPFYRWFISQGIAYFTKNDGQDLDEVKVHTAIVYEWENEIRVREMEKDKAVSILLSDYLTTFGDRVEIVPMDTSFVKTRRRARFNIACHTEEVTYDYANTFLYQIIKSVIGKWVGRNSKYKRTCVEDATRMYNRLDYIFLEVERTNPNECYNFIKSK